MVHRPGFETVPEAYHGFTAAHSCSHVYQGIMIPVLLLFLVLVLRRCSHLRQRGRMTQGQFVSVCLVVMGLVNSILWITDTMVDVVMDTGHMKTALAALQRTASSHSDAHPSPPTLVSTPPDPGDSMIGLVDVSFRYPSSNVIVLQDRTIHFERGRCTGLVGGIGKGKTTIIRLMLGICRPRKGHLYVDGSWYDDLSVTRIRQLVSFVPQVAVLFDDSLLFNVRYGNESTHSEEEVERFVRQYAGDSLVHVAVGPGGQNLSGGQRQLVWCLRIFLRSAPVIVYRHSPCLETMDEPSASMDATTKQTLLMLLQRAVQTGTTVILASHDSEILTACHRVVQL